jgi:hypothetical protein
MVEICVTRKERVACKFKFKSYSIFLLSLAKAVYHNDAEAVHS